MTSKYLVPLRLSPSDGLCGSYPSKPDRIIISGLPTIHPEPRLSLPTTPFPANFGVADVHRM
jgi:hypothetical protein